MQSVLEHLRVLFTEGANSLQKRNCHIVLKLGSLLCILYSDIHKKVCLLATSIEKSRFLVASLVNAITFASDYENYCH